MKDAPPLEVLAAIPGGEKVAPLFARHHAVRQCHQGHGGEHHDEPDRDESALVPSGLHRP
jgi:hypothetical protein